MDTAPQFVEKGTGSVAQSVVTQAETLPPRCLSPFATALTLTISRRERGPGITTFQRVPQSPGRMAAVPKAMI
jgi:hypothetical protein